VSESVFYVKGMTCDHCVEAVTREVSAVTGVESVQIELESGKLTVLGTGVDAIAVDEAVIEAGYELL
jgi:copper chaperone CopZ